MFFSERMNFQEKKLMQLQDIDEDLKILLWNVVIRNINNIDTQNDGGYKRLKYISEKYWHELFKLPIDTIPFQAIEKKREFKNKYMKLTWYKIYDFLELSSEFFGKQFEIECNKELEKENSGYRFINGIISPIIEEVEIQAIVEACTSDAYSQASVHITNALNLLSDKTNPDYKNSMKESISAVETLAKIIANKPNKTLPDILKQDLEFHPALVSAMSAIYGYTSDEGGIRHGNKPVENSIDKSHAIYLLVTCSAIFNFIKQNLPKNKKK